MKIYTGVNRLENWLIDQSYSTFVQTKSLGVMSNVRSTKLPEETAFADEVFVSSESSVQSNDPTRSIIGSNMVRVGIAILMVPDPVPVIDEIVGAGLIAIGATLLAIS